MRRYRGRRAPPRRDPMDRDPHSTSQQQAEGEEPPRYALDRASLERDCTVEFLRVGGPGGQHRNRRETGVRLLHRPTGVVVQATERRSQQQNLAAAYARLADRLARRQARRKRRKPTAPSAAVKQRRLDDKRQRADRKAQRRWRPED